MAGLRRRTCCKTEGGDGDVGGMCFCFSHLLVEVKGGQQSLHPTRMTSVPLTQHLSLEDGSGSSPSAAAENFGLPGGPDLRFGGKTEG